MHGPQKLVQSRLQHCLGGCQHNCRQAPPTAPLVLGAFVDLLIGLPSLPCPCGEDRDCCECSGLCGLARYGPEMRNAKLESKSKSKALFPETATDHQPAQPYWLKQGIFLPAMFSSPDAHKSDDSSEEDTDAAASEDVATVLQAALQDVPASTHRKRSEAMATQVLSQQRSPQASPRGSLVAAEALAKPVETSTAAACETPVESCTARKKERVSTAPSQQQSLPDCQGGSPLAAKALQQLAVVSATTDEKQEVHLGSDNWSTEAVVSSRLAAAEASKSEDVAAASTHPITLQTITREVFIADFDELLAGKKSYLRPGLRRRGVWSDAQADRHFAGSQVVQAGSSDDGGEYAAPHSQDKGARSVDRVQFPPYCRDT